VSSDFYGTGVLTFSVYGVITSTDSSTDAIIDYVAWTAAAPDAQFQQPLVSSLYELQPTAALVRKQADICQAFTKTFPPYVDGCEYLTDSGYVAAELSRSPMDVLKRYQLFASEIAPNTPLPGNYVPNESTLGWQIRTAFLFQRGGVNYKVFPDYTNQSDLITPANVANAKWTVAASWPFYSPTINYNNATGLPFMAVGQSDSEIDLSVPYTNQYPFIYTNPGTVPFSVPGVILVTPRQNPTSFVPGPPQVTNYLTGMNVYTCVRDDYMMGWLLAPTPYSASPKKDQQSFSQSEPARPHSRSTLQPKQLSIKDFYPY